MIETPSAIIMLNALAYSTASAALIPLATLTTLPRCCLLASITLVLLVPVNGLALAAYARGIVGDLSILSYALLLFTLLADLNNRQLFASQERNWLYTFVVLGALILYPASLGLSHFSPYDFAYNNVWFIGAVLLLASICWLKGLLVTTLLICIAIMAYHWQLLESSNPWDYLIDPLLAFYGLAFLLRQSVNTNLTKETQRNNYADTDTSKRSE